MYGVWSCFPRLCFVILRLSDLLCQRRRHHFVLRLISRRVKHGARSAELQFLVEVGHFDDRVFNAGKSDGFKSWRATFGVVPIVTAITFIGVRVEFAPDNVTLGVSPSGSGAQACLILCQRESWGGSPITCDNVARLGKGERERFCCRP